MAKLYWRPSSMNAGKTAIAIQDAYNYKELGLECLFLLPSLDTRFGEGKAASRTGLEYPAIIIEQNINLYQLVRSHIITLREEKGSLLKAVIVDEAQFLTTEQVNQLGEVVDKLNIPVLVYGLRTTFQGELFEGSKRLYEICDVFEEPRITLCWCGSKATMNARIVDEKVAMDGETVQIGGSELYIPLCRKHFNEGKWRR